MKESPEINTQELECDDTVEMIIDEESDCSGLNEQSGVTFGIKNINIKVAGEANEFGYYSANLLKEKKLKLMIKNKDGLKEIDLPSDMLERISEFITREDDGRRGRFDCNSFAHLVNGVAHGYGILSFDQWDKFKLDKDCLNPGDTIVMVTKDDKITYLAIYLGDDIYLSKFGVRGRLMAATLAEMQKSFGGTETFLIRPKPAANDLAGK